MRYILHGQSWQRFDTGARHFGKVGLIAGGVVTGLLVLTIVIPPASQEGLTNQNTAATASLASHSGVERSGRRTHESRARHSRSHFDSWRLAVRENIIDTITNNDQDDTSDTATEPADDQAAPLTPAIGSGSVGLANPAPIALLAANIDHREYMHGLDFVKFGGRDMVIFASNNYTPTSPADEWGHDIFYSYVDPANPGGSLSVKTLVAASQAQEPASSAVNSAGRLMVTSEDAQFSQDLDQTYGLWDAADAAPKPTTPYGAKLMPPQGGHSGHVAASGDKFLVSFSDGWVDGGGVDNLGTGDEVYARVVNNDGTTGSLIMTAVGKDRDWWPIVAGSDSNWLQVWQRYGTAGTGGGSVMGAIIDHSGKIVKQLKIYDNNKYYYHDVQYLPALGLYLVTGSQNSSGNSGIAVLVDKSGNIVATKTGLPGTNRESQTVTSQDGRTAVYAVPGTGAAVLDLTSTSIALRKTVNISWSWDYMGTDGIFTADNKVLFATGTQLGIRFITVGLE